MKLISRHISLRLQRRHDCGALRTTKSLLPATMGCLEKRRAELIVFIVLPISLAVWTFNYLRRCCSAPKATEHVARVLRVARQVRRVASLRQEQSSTAGSSGADEPVALLRTDRSAYASHSVRNAAKSDSVRIRMGDLRAILGVLDDPTASASSSSGRKQRGKVVHVEPGVTVGEVTSYLLRQNPPLQLSCTLEMEEATLGGLAMAQGMTTHSHVCGLVSETVTEYEVSGLVGACGSPCCSNLWSGYSEAHVGGVGTVSFAFASTTSPGRGGRGGGGVL